MSRIQEILEQADRLCDRGYKPDEYQLKIMLLRALDVVADAILSITKELDEQSRNLDN